MHLVQVLLPLFDPDGARFGREALDRVGHELTERFGGLTAYTRAPAAGLWKEGGQTQRDDIVVVEVMVEELDPAWWGAYRSELETRFRQEEIVVRAQEIVRL
jgi:hypothetical protein